MAKLLLVQYKQLNCRREAFLNLESSARKFCRCPCLGLSPGQRSSEYSLAFLLTLRARLDFRGWGLLSTGCTVSSSSSSNFQKPARSEPSPDRPQPAQQTARLVPALTLAQTSCASYLACGRAEPPCLDKAPAHVQSALPGPSLPGPFTQDCPIITPKQVLSIKAYPNEHGPCHLIGHI